MDLKAILAGLQTVATTAEALAPMLTPLGLGKTVTDYVSAGLALAGDIKTALANHEAIADADDQAAIDQIIADLEARADQLSAEVDKS